MKVKYQIFVSSTYDDLKEERNQVIKATLEIGHVPVGMEMFSAADEEQWKLITRQIDESDYYVVIIAHRYGSVENGISYTEKEYDYAVSTGIPALGFIIDESTSWKPNKMESNVVNKEALEKFKDKVKRKPVSFWKSAEDLYGKVPIALIKAFTANPRQGWVRSSEIAGADVVNELSRLSGENAVLRKEIGRIKKKTESDIIAEQERLMEILSKNVVVIPIFYEGADDWNRDKKKNLWELFNILAPELMIEKELLAIGSIIALHSSGERRKELRKKWPLPTNIIKGWLADLMALELVKPSTRKHLVKDMSEYWMLTDKGRDLHSKSRLLKLYKGIAVREEVIEPTSERKKQNRGKGVKEVTDEKK